MKVFKKSWVVLLIVLFVVGCAQTHLSADGSRKMVEEEFRIHAEENEYTKFIDFIESEMTEEEYELLKKVLNGEYINQGLKTLKYSSVSGNKDYCYLNGVYTLPYNVQLTVKWARNMEIDVYNDNYKCNRHFVVSNPNKEAYMIIGGDENGYQLIRIVPDDFEESEFDAEYTKEGYDYLYDALENHKNYLLATIVQNEAISNELISSLYLNKKDYEYLAQYVSQMPEELRDEIFAKFKDGEINYGIVTIFGIAPFVNDYLVYDHGEFFINPESNWQIKWSQNIIEFADDENSDHKYVIDDRRNNAYAVIQKEEDFCLLYFDVTGKSE